MTILITGAAGFIGAAVSRKLLAAGRDVIGVDCVNAYYDPALKEARLALLEGQKNFRLIRADVADRAAMDALRGENIEAIIHLAAQAGVRYSLEQPRAYTDSNLVGHSEILELARAKAVRHLVYASSSSVYGANTKVPFSEDDRTDDPVSFYGATKKCCELMSESYARLYQLPQTGLRFFTVYGPMGRPDMAYMIFARKILAGEPIQVFGEGKMGRDFTYVDDTVDGVIAALDRPPNPEERVPHQVFNLGNDQPEELSDMIAHLERLLGRQAQREILPMQPGDVRRTWADISKARATLGYAPKTRLLEGLEQFVDWYKDYLQQN